ncbi:MAG: hypothetical protein QNJ60_18820 [Xenococcaceae cyanobacterium MO_188.B19]|nr:hypothetical protein [Xenococcaceae cyanobacterium MO_188.B19]
MRGFARVFGKNDILIGSSGDDILDGGKGTDIADYSDLSEAITLEVEL